MKEATGATYQGSEYAKSLILALAKEGKTCNIVAGLLGVLPWQQEGGVVSAPSHLHVIGLDANALGGVREFVKATCGAKEEALGYRTYSMQDDCRDAYDSKVDYDGRFYGILMSTMDTIYTRVEKEKGVHAVVISSLTGVVQALQRALFGPPNLSASKKSAADMNKWAQLGSQIAQLQNYFQQDTLHTIWEAHLQKKGEDNADSLAIQGSAGKNFPFNVEQVFRYRRAFGSKHASTKCDVTYLDTKPTLEFAANGRGFNEGLEAKEPDITVAFRKLGLKVGNWK